MKNVAGEMDIEEKEIPVLPENVNLFGSRKLNIAEDKVFWQDVEPAYMDDKPPQAVYFDYANNSNNFVDLARTLLYLKLAIVDDEDKPFTQAFVENRAPANQASPIDLILQTMWQNLEIKLNGYSVYDSQQNYMYSAFLQYLLNSSAQTKKFQGSFMGSSPDTRYFEATDGCNIPPVNSGMSTRRGWRMGVHRTGTVVARKDEEELSCVEYLGPLFADICNQDRYMLNNVRLEMTFRPTSDKFRLMCQGSKNAYLKIVTAKLQVCNVELDPRIKVSIDNMMSQETLRARYPIQKTVVRTFRAANGSRQFFENDMFRGKVPSKMIVGLVSEEAYHGSYAKNPFFFDTFNIASIAVRLGNSSIPTRPIQLDFEDCDYLLGLQSLYRTVGRGVMDVDIGIDRDNYRQGLALYGFSIDPGSEENIGLMGKPKYDLLQLVINFSEALREGVMVVMFATFPDEITLDWARVARVESDIPA